MKQPSVLIVDDEPDLLVMMQTGLEADGFKTALAGDGHTALERVADHGPDVVLLDLMMPLADGWSVLETLGGRERRPGLIVVSAKTRDSDKARAFRLGADAYVTKPFSFDELSATILDVAGRSTAERRSVRARNLEAYGEPADALD